MAEKKTAQRARRRAREGKAPSTQAGEFVREEIEHVREGAHGAKSTRQAIAIGLSKARRAGVELPPPEPGTTSEATRRRAERDLERERRPRSRNARPGGAPSASPRGPRCGFARVRRETGAFGRSPAERRGPLARGETGGPHAPAAQGRPPRGEEAMSGSAETVIAGQVGCSTLVSRGGAPMQVKDIMSTDAACCARDASLIDVSRLMVEHDCGEIPVCDADGRPVGVVTDRDIVCRAIAKQKDARSLTAADVMSTPVVTVKPDLSIEDCARLMEQYQVRRVPVVDAQGICCGILAQADLARKAPRDTSIEVLSTISEPNAFASNVGGR